MLILVLTCSVDLVKHYEEFQAQKAKNTADTQYLEIDEAFRKGGTGLGDDKGQARNNPLFNDVRLLALAFGILDFCTGCW